MSDLTVTEARRLARAQRLAAEALSTGDRQQIADAQAQLEEVRHDLFEGDDE